MTPPEHRVVDLHPIYRSGSVTRWHTYPEVPAQSLADHHGRVAQIILFFWPNCEASLLYAALHHDCGEMIVGDVPKPRKSATSPKTKDTRFSKIFSLDVHFPVAYAARWAYCLFKGNEAHPAPG